MAQTLVTRVLAALGIRWAPTLPQGRNLPCIGGPLNDLMAWLDAGAVGLEVWRVDGCVHIMPGRPVLESPASAIVGRYALLLDRESGTEWLQYRPMDTSPACN